MAQHDSSNSSTIPRYERKYLIPSHCPSYLDTLIKLHPAFFHEIYHERVINNIYFDNNQLQSYFDNLNGLGYRLKYRLRWYGKPSSNNQSRSPLTNATTQPHFEIKKRTGDLISKYVFASDAVYASLKSIIPETIHPLFNYQNLPSLANKVHRDIHHDQSSTNILSLKKISLLKPILLNSYSRRYYLSQNKKVRVTVDTQICYHEVNNNQINWLHRWKLPATILEIKADQAHDNEIAQCAKFFPLPLTKSSKYVLGAMSCVPDIESPLYNIPVRPQLA